MTRKRQLAAALDQAIADNLHLGEEYAYADQAAQWFWQRWLGAVADSTQWRQIASTQLARIGVVLTDNQRLTADRHRLAADNRLLRRIRLQLSAENRRLREQRDALAEANERLVELTGERPNLTLVHGGQTGRPRDEHGRFKAAAGDG